MQYTTSRAKPAGSSFASSASLGTSAASCGNASSPSSFFLFFLCFPYYLSFLFCLPPFLAYISSESAPSSNAAIRSAYFSVPSAKISSLFLPFLCFLVFFLPTPSKFYSSCFYIASSSYSSSEAALSSVFSGASLVSSTSSKSA